MLAVVADVCRRQQLVVDAIGVVIAYAEIELAHVVDEIVNGSPFVVGPYGVVVVVAGVVVGLAMLGVMRAEQLVVQQWVELGRNVGQIVEAIELRMSVPGSL